MFRDMSVTHVPRQNNAINDRFRAHGRETVTRAPVFAPNLKPVVTRVRRGDL